MPHGGLISGEYEPRIEEVTLPDTGTTVTLYGERHEAENVIAYEDTIQDLFEEAEQFSWEAAGRYKVGGGTELDTEHDEYMQAWINLAGEEYDEIWAPDAASVDEIYWGGMVGLGHLAALHYVGRDCFVR